MRAEKPVLIPEHAYESQGMEDPRIVKIEDTYYLTYTGYDRTNALGCIRHIDQTWRRSPNTV
jgi:predicted GH43/DUF377 family glycosyl hydrolase